MVTRLSDTVVDTQCEGQFQHIPGLSSGLNFVVQSGFFFDSVLITFPQTTLVLPDDSTVNVVINFDNTPATLDALVVAPSEGLLLYKVVTVAGVVTSITDLRWRATTSRLVNPSWVEVIEGLDPDVWWDLTEGALPYVHRGSDVVEIDLSDGPGPSDFQQDGPTGTGNAARFNAVDFAESSGDGLQDISAQIITGTFVCVFHTDIKEGFGYFFEAFANFDIDGIAVTTQGSGILQLHTQNAGATNYTQTWVPGTIADPLTGIMDDQWHMIVMIQTGDATDASVIGYLDGVLLPTPPDGLQIDPGIDPEYWITDFGPSDAVCIGSRGSPNENHMRGEIDELMYFSKQLTQANVTAMWNTISGNVARPETLGNAIVTVFNKPHLYLPLQAEELGQYAALFSSATNPLGPFTQDGTVTVGADGFNANEKSIGFTPTGVNNGDRLLDTSLSSSEDTFDLATGTLGMMFQIDDLQSWDANLWGTANNTSTPAQQGWIQHTVDTTGANAGRILIQFYENTTDRSTFSLALQDEGVIDILDGNWHQVLITQSNDGTGITWYIDGREYLPANIFSTQNHTSTFAEDAWFVDIKTDATRFAIGANGPPTENNTLDGKVSHWFLDSKVITAAEATRIWDATGL